MEVEFYVANDAEWETYKQKFGKKYQPQDEAEKIKYIFKCYLRRKAWEETIEMVNKHNEEYKKGQQTFTMGVNQFADGTRPGKGLNRGGGCCGGNKGGSHGGHGGHGGHGDHGHSHSGQGDKCGREGRGSNCGNSGN